MTQETESREVNNNDVKKRVREDKDLQMMWLDILENRVEHTTRHNERRTQG